MSVRLKITKKGKIIMLIVAMLLLAGSGGYLLWRVNQQESVSPDDSEATGGIGACCGTPGCVAGWKCDTTQSCSETKTVTCGTGDPAVISKCPTYKGATAKSISSCSSNGTATCTYTFGPSGSTGGKCVKETSETGPTEGTCTNKCEWPQTLMSDKNCACEKCDSTNGCTGDPPTTCSSLGGCPTGYVSCGDSVSYEENNSACVKQSSVSCTVYHKDCNNPSVIYRYCKPKTSTNTCDSGTWVTKPSGTYAYCADIAYSVNAIDSDGVNESSVSVKLNNSSRSNVTKSTSGTTTNISETLSGSTSCLAPGTYTLDMSWADTKGATSSSCTLSTTFTVESVETNPDWDIEKTAVEKCEDEETENPIAQITYAITVENTGDASGVMEKIVDTPDSKVKEAYISNISNGGTYSEGVITWALEATFEAGEKRSYTYTLSIPKSAFGKYENTVTGYPAEGDNVTASANITTDCSSVPDTGLFDTVQGRIIVGFVLIIIGLGFSHAQSVILLLGKKTKIHIRDMREDRIIKKFEKKVVKK